eukprot:TRINITY_DN9377_c0_g1_i10.p1 TRINITY_DN9377_c0_g1~~TRINITY_DN9377_c0_g1_i10.p1  ORF type:complete len:507 (-),score=114.11 TRINITY_DN9377_c0_g1_i10:756-2276(-)
MCIRDSINAEYGDFWHARNGATLKYHSRRQRTGMSNRASYQSCGHRGSRSASRASNILARENAKQAMVWGLQAGGASVDQIEANAPHVLRAASQLSMQDEQYRRAGIPQASDLFAEGKFRQATRLRRVICGGGVTGDVEGQLSELQETRGLKGRETPSTPVREGRQKRAEGSSGTQLPIEQARSIFKERIKSLMLQDNASFRRLFNKYDTHDVGWIGSRAVHHLCLDLGMQIGFDTVDNLVRKTSEDASARLSFDDFVHNLLALPHDFFSMNFTSKAFQKIAEPSKPRNTLPAGTPVQQLHSAVSTALRGKLFKLEVLVHEVFKAMPGKHTFDRLGLWETLTRLGVTTKEAPFNEVFKYFDYRKNSNINQVEFICGLLGLPYPKAVAPPPALLLSRPRLSPKGAALLQKIKRSVEDVGIKGKTPGENVRRVWKNYDTDGSGEIAYDEIQKMTAEFDIGVDGQNAAAKILKYVDRTGEGKVNYRQFVTDFMGLDGRVLSGQGARWFV